MVLIAVPLSSLADEFLKALDQAISKEFKAFARHFLNPNTKLASAWDLGCGVDIHVVGRGDPELKVFVARSDVVNRRNRDNEQNMYRFRATSKTSLFLPIVINMAKTYLRDNQHKLAIHKENVKARKKELGSLDIPDSITVMREPATGTYVFQLNLRYAECPPKVIKKAVRAAKALFRALE